MHRDYIHEIQTIRRHGLGGLETWLRGVMRQQHPGVKMPTETKDGPLRYARVEQGRWIIDCPDCNGAALADPEDRRFLCPDCLNAASGGSWLPVVFPEALDALERELLKRPIVNRNWLPHESLSDISAENVLRGVDKISAPSVETAFARGHR